MTNYINEKNIRDEVAVFLKNEDVLSTSERGVTSIVGSSYGSLSSETSMTIERSNVRNIRR